ncbi:hypothetical protein HN014_18205 [Aquimarina sp. TRL1]|uniref:YceI family protein n=1 Tax=Aquimarina sp. (strain TRL1) TaxID=2736252 RepID=UPI00158F4CBC|nr:YceI family protein [Aquimarina sp. TRL1]QKX06766.1 hypothetical protein HN014_18205 [Aquimarina sp. TRL1]
MIYRLLYMFVFFSLSSAYAQFEVDHFNGTDLINDISKLEFDREKSSVRFFFEKDSLYGRIKNFEYDISFQPTAPENSYIRGTASVASLTTQNILRDHHLMWESYFYKRKHPYITFNSSQIIDFGSQVYKVIGWLTIKGITKEVIFHCTLQEHSLEGKTVIYTSDYNINIHDTREQNKLLLTFSFPFISFPR